jgi:hypothetical protein
MKQVDLTRIKVGAVFGRLVVERFTPGESKITCRCACGKHVSPDRSNLLGGRTQSCGCLQRERIRRHGGVGTPEYAVWLAIVQRCTNPNNENWPNYGGRGIKLHEPWRDEFADFLKEVGKRPKGKGRLTLERRDNNKGYVPGNVYWAPYSAQNRNRRNNHNLTFRGKTQCLIDWAKETGISFPTIIRRLNAGWSVKKALTTKPLERGRRVWARDRGRLP